MSVRRMADNIKRPHYRIGNTILNQGDWRPGKVIEVNDQDTFGDMGWIWLSKNDLSRMRGEPVPKYR